MSADPRPSVVLLRGHHANVWDLRPWELLMDRYDVTVLVTGSNLHEVGGTALREVKVRTPRDALPAGRAAGAAAYLLGERYLGLRRHVRDAAIVHAAELGTWHSAQAARLRDNLDFRLAVTVWETIPWRDTYRWPRERAYRRSVLAAADLFLPTTERARAALLLEGAAPDRTRVCAPGVDVEDFAAAASRARTAGPSSSPRQRILSAGRLVWEKGHQDVLRALAALRGGLVGPAREDVELLIVGSGPDGRKLRAYARELGLGEAVTFRSTVPHAEMPALYAGASCLVLASLPTRAWEEQFGMVLVEAMSCGTPVVACSTGAIPEVLADCGGGTLVGPGDWIGLARALAEGPLAARSTGSAPADAARLEHFSTTAAAERLATAYASLLS